MGGVLPNICYWHVPPSKGEEGRRGGGEEGRRGGKTPKEHGFVLPYLQTLQSLIGFRISKCDA